MSRAVPSRDREGAVSLRLPHEHRHQFSLLLDNIPNCCSNSIPIPQPPCTPVPRPSLSIRFAGVDLIQSPTGIRFERVHRQFGFCLSLDNHMNVIGAHVRSQQRPVSMRANFSYRVQHGATPRSVQHVRSLVHQLAFARCTRLIVLLQPVSRNVMVPIYGTGFVAVHVSAVARERNQVRHARLFYTAPSRSRLGRGRSRLGRGRSRLGSEGHKR
jgi:hypothetical protein